MWTMCRAVEKSRGLHIRVAARYANAHIWISAPMLEAASWKIGGSASPSSPFAPAAPPLPGLCRFCGGDDSAAAAAAKCCLPGDGAAALPPGATCSIRNVPCCVDRVWDSTSETPDLSRGYCWILGWQSRLSNSCAIHDAKSIQRAVTTYCCVEGVMSPAELTAARAAAASHSCWGRRTPQAPTRSH